MNQRDTHREHHDTAAANDANQPHPATSGTVRLTTAQALVRYLCAQRVASEDGNGTEPLFGGVFAIFGHGNVAGMGEALYQHRDELPTLRAHNEQAMAPCRDCVCQGAFPPPHDGGHDLDRTRRDESA